MHASPAGGDLERAVLLLAAVAAAHSTAADAATLGAMCRDALRESGDAAASQGGPVATAKAGAGAAAAGDEGSTPATPSSTEGESDGRDAPTLIMAVDAMKSLASRVDRELAAELLVGRAGDVLSSAFALAIAAEEWGAQRAGLEGATRCAQLRALGPVHV